MSKITCINPFEQLHQDCSIPALLTEALQLLNYYIDDDSGLEPVVSAQFLLQHTLDLLTRKEQTAMTDTAWDKDYLVFSVNRPDLENQLGFSHDQISRLSDLEMQILAEQVREDLGWVENTYSESVMRITTSLLAKKSKRQEEGI